jgi:hypothetical protein
VVSFHGCFRHGPQRDVFEGEKLGFTPEQTTAWNKLVTEMADQVRVIAPSASPVAEPEQLGCTAQALEQHGKFVDVPQLEQGSLRERARKLVENWQIAFHQNLQDGVAELLKSHVAVFAEQVQRETRIETEKELREGQKPTGSHSD